MSGAFDLLDAPLVYIPVEWPGIAADENGDARTVDHVVHIQVEILDRDDCAQWIVDANKYIGRRTVTGEDGVAIVDPNDKRTDDEIRAERAAHELETFKRVAKGWKRMKAGNRDAPFNDQNIARLLKWPGFVSAFGAAYMAAWNGEKATREGNSAGSPATGQAGEPTVETAPAATSSAS